MTRKTAGERHQDSAPATDSWPPEAGAVIDALIAVHHPARRRLYEILTVGGPANVGQLARQTGLAVGSVSHHLKRLHRAGFVTPAPELARDTRESVWRGVRRRFSWSADDFLPGSVARDVADVAERNNFEHHTRTTLSWMRDRSTYPEPWNELGLSADNLVRATPEQFAELQAELDRVLHAWDQRCRDDARSRPDVERMPVRTIVRAFPSDPGAA
ncbi:ArsR/SmtB family transcription factor [Microlunatus soli]|nr:helix-turn-helix domain-containing protein [Microlunatus soli]